MLQNMIFYVTQYTDLLDVPLREINYDYDDINRAIVARSDAVEDNRTKKIGESLYNNYLYQLFVIEFVNYVNNERNEVLREKLKKLIRNTNFNKNMAEFRKEWRELLKDYPEDFMTLRDQLIVFYQWQFDKPSLLNIIDNTVYEFDRITMNKLKKLPHQDLIKELHAISGEFSVQRDFNTSNITFPNIYLPCSEFAGTNTTGYCDKSKLMINRPIDEFIDILAADFANDLKYKYILNNLWQDTVLSYFDFTRISTEIITIYRMDG